MDLIYNEIINHNKIIIIRHKSPDYDAYGSQIGLYLSLKQTFKSKEIYLTGDESNSNIFGIKMDKLSSEEYKDSLVIIVDTSGSNMIYDENYKNADKVCIFDHHDNIPDIESISVIKSEYSSCAELISEFIFKYSLFIDKKIADSLYIGIVGDSNRFLYKGTTEHTFLMASKLIECGADIINDYKAMQKDEKESEKRMKGYVLSNFKIKENVAYVYTSKEVLDKFGVNSIYASRGCINQLAGIENIEAFIGFTEADDKSEIYIEIRSRSIPVVEVAKKYSGGGHLLACGARVPIGYDYMKVVDDLIKEIKG